MSCTSLYLVYGTKATHVAEYPNAWGSAPALWNATWRGYLGRLGFPDLMGDDLNGVKAVMDDSEAPAYLKRMLKWTWKDGRIFTLAQAPMLAEDCRKAHALCKENARAEMVNHWGMIATDVEPLSRRRDKRIRGIGIAATSVQDYWADWRP